MSIFVCDGKTEEAKKIVNLVLGLAESNCNKGLFLRWGALGAMAERVEQAAKRWMWPVGFHMQADQKLRLKNLLKI